MPVFAVDIEKYKTGVELQPWSNNYHIIASTLDDAVTAAGQIVSLERNLHTGWVQFARLRVSTVLAEDDVFTTIPLGGGGNMTTSGDQMPSFLAFRLDLVPTFGRNGRKFYHLLLGEGDQADGQWASAAMDNLEAVLAPWFADSGNPTLVNESGAKSYLSYVMNPNVTQHQFRRGSKRRIPILP